MVKRGIFLVIFLLFFLTSVSGLGVSPAKITMDFVPGYTNTFEYKVSDVPANSDVIIYLEGDLSRYVSLSHDSLEGNGKFSLRLNLPHEIETPGRNRIMVVVEEVPKKDSFGMVSTAIILKTAIDIFVPYPGEYLEIERFFTSDVNIGESVFFELSLKNKGKENLSIQSHIDIFSLEGDFIETLDLGESILDVLEEKEFFKELKTKDYNPGKYNANAVVSYSGKSTNKTIPFRIGNLSVDIINYTDKYILKEGINKFELYIESGWNNKIEGVYADVVFFNKTKEVVDFKTTTTSLVPWEIQKIEGYFDSSEFLKGNYSARVSLNYFGRDVGRTKTEVFDIEFIEEDESNIYFIVLLLVVFLVILFFVLIFLKFYLKKIIHLFKDR